MELLPIDGRSPFLLPARQLYEQAFPACERRPFAELTGRPGLELLALTENGRFAGLLSLLTRDGVTFILYFAVCPGLRCHGLGQQALALLARRFPANRIVADLEEPLPTRPEPELRTRRIGFYARCGFHDTGVRYNWQGEDYRLMVRGGDFTDAEFRAFWRRKSPAREEHNKE